MTYSKEYICKRKEELCKITCPICNHVFYVDSEELTRHCNCIKCGSSWYAIRPILKEKSSKGLKIFGVEHE